LPVINDPGAAFRFLSTVEGIKKVVKKDYPKVMMDPFFRGQLQKTGEKQ
jgi:hypothetical protein